MKKQKSTIMGIFEKAINLSVSFGGIIPAQKVIILAPHQDDEAIGCGGTILRYLEGGAEVFVIYLTDGCYGVKSNEKNVRKEEAEAAWEHYDGIHQFFWDFEDSNIARDRERVLKRLIDFIESIKPDIIFTPWFLDRHIDHVTTSQLLSEAMKKLNDLNCWIGCYEVMFPLFSNFSVNITKQMEQKMEILNKYKSQVKFLHITEVTRNLNLYRGSIVHLRSVKYAEGFFVSNTETFADLIEAVK